MKSQDQGDSSSSDESGAQPPLAGMSQLESASAQFEAAFLDLLGQAGISQCFEKDSKVELGYSMALPKNTLGTSSTDFAVLAWWFLANVNGQLIHIYHNSKSTAEWSEVVSNLLGGTDLGHGFFVIDVLSDIKNPIHQYAVTLMAALANYRIFTKPRKLAMSAQGFVSQTDGAAS